MLYPRRQTVTDFPHRPFHQIAEYLPHIGLSKFKLGQIQCGTVIRKNGYAPQG